MTVTQILLNWLEDMGLWEDEARAILEVTKTAPENSAM